MQAESACIGATHAVPRVRVGEWRRTSDAEGSSFHQTHVPKVARSFDGRKITDMAIRALTPETGEPLV